ncbi:MAG: dihydrolipoyl dehydrogenase [Bacteroidales bacterium]|jgi:dihydrolipoamide dehydrogenase|nr:dihydrolipoyl dehydrogenase [Bacteroidales bacterium]
MNYDLTVIGSGPGGYVAAIRASQLGLKTAIVEREHLGGICLNWGCIPTKSLLKSAQVYRYFTHAADYGVALEGTARPDYAAIVARSRGVAEGMSKGIQFLLQKNKIDVIRGSGKLAGKGTVAVTDAEGKTSTVTAAGIILATGARSRQLPHLPIDGKKIIGYRQALALPQQPKTMLVVGSGAIGSELAFFYQSIGTQVTLVEFMPQIVPLEDEEVARQLERSFKKAGMKVMIASTVESVDTSGEGCVVTIKTAKGAETQQADIVLSAVGITPNIENIGLEEMGIEIEKGRVKVDARYQTSVAGVFAIGDIIATPALAHVASAEGIACVEYIAGLNPEPINYRNIPGCTYTTPEVASVGMTEKAAKEAGYGIKVGKFPYTASGKASAAVAKDGFVKLIFDEEYGELLGAHLIGENVTEMLAELVVARNLEATGHELIKSIHPHPTMSEAIMEAAAAACGEVIHI